MSWNGLALAHYVGCVTWLALKDLLGALSNIMGTIPFFIGNFLIQKFKKIKIKWRVC
jgi:hypothetical protein